MDLKPGSRWKSAVCDAELVVVRAPKSPVSLECGGHPVIPHAEARSGDLTLSDAHAAARRGLRPRPAPGGPRGDGAGGGRRGPHAGVTVVARSAFEAACASPGSD